MYFGGPKAHGYSGQAPEGVWAYVSRADSRRLFRGRRRADSSPAEAGFGMTIFELDSN